MTIPMNNTLSNLSRDRAQHLFNKNVELESKRRKAAQAKIPSDPNAWQQMRENYESILLEDHAFSEQHDIEYALWQLHYKHIEELRAHYSAAQAQNAKVPAPAPSPARPGPARITKIRSQFKTFLSEATGFYHDLMVKIRAKYRLSLGHISDDPQHDIDMKKGLISCHRCFIYLGDLARYKGLYGEGDSKTRDFDAASSYYKQAATLWPSSGNPHHQLAILASYSGDELLAVYRYFRSLAVDTPFTTARDNLIIAFEKNRQSYCQLLGDSKAAPNKKAPARVTGKGRNKGETWISSKDRKTEPNLVVERESTTMPETLKAFSIRFVRLNGILFTRTSLETFLEVFSVARSDFLQLLSSGQDEVFNFGSDYGECKLFITRFIAIMIFTVYNVNKKETEHQSYAEILQRSVVLQNAFAAIFDFMALILERCIQLNDPSASFLLPGIMIFVEWLAFQEDLASTNEMEEKQVAARSFFWNQFILFLNKILINENGDETRLALPEDMELRGFLPLVSGQLVLDFTRTNYLDENKEKKARVQRIVAAGKKLTNSKNVGVRHQGFYFDSKSKQFLFGIEPQNNINHDEEKLECEEEDDEVIVFKPSVPEKHTHTDELLFPSKLIDNPTPVHEACASSVNENTKQYSRLQQPEEFIENGFFSNLNLLGGKEFEKQSTGMSSVGIQEPESIIIPSKFDSVMTSAAPSFGTIPSKTKPIKSPVSRPIRHYGPPPGFNNTVGPKYAADEHLPQPLFGVNLRNGNGNENQPLDDYSWLDGYQLPYSGYNNGIGIGNSWRCLPQPNKLLNTRKMSLGMESFPFPGKQVSSVVEAENGIQKQQNGNGGYQIPMEHGNGNLYEQEEGKKGDEEFIAVPQQYQGQSLWEGRFFV